MSLTAIPLQFEKYLQNQISVGDAPDMNEMIFAYLPDLDLETPIDREQGLPDVAYWVHQQDIDQVGKLGDNALVYSVVIPGSVSAFTFNAIYLRDKNVPNSCGMVVHKADETKEDGMSSTKSLLQQYTGAAQIAGINVDAATWQIDYQARLFGIEGDMRLANLDNYGHTAFVDGFDVTQQADPTKYAISAGVAYVGGLRAVLDAEVIQTITTKPNGIYLDVVRMGTVLSEWQNIVTLRLSDVELVDYLDENNQQHYVAKLAGINADGSVSDWRVKGGLGEHEAASDPHTQYPLSSKAQGLEYDPDRTYYCGDTCYTRVGDRTYQWEAYSLDPFSGKDPSDPLNRRVGWTDVTKPFYWKPRSSKMPGETMAWDNDAIPENMVLAIGQQLPVAVYHSLAAAKPEWIDETDNTLINIPDRQGRFVRAADGASWLAGETHEDAIRNITASFYTNNGWMFTATSGAMGRIGGQQSMANATTTAGAALVSPAVDFDASRVVPTAAENQPKAYIEWVGYAL